MFIPIADDFAKNIEKTLATILNKKEKEAAAISGGEEKNKEKVEERRGRKRRKHEKDRKVYTIFSFMFNFLSCYFLLRTNTDVWTLLDLK